MTTLFGRRVVLRPLELADFPAWREVRVSNGEWLTRWEPQRIGGQPDSTRDRDAFAVRCSARQRERQLGTGYGFGIFVDRGQQPGGDGRQQAASGFMGEINLSAIQRGPFQSAYVGYWIDERQAGRSFVPEALVVLARFAFDDLQLHRIQVAIIPRNKASRRVVEKLGLREEGVALRYLEINGVWEDHLRYAITTEEWQERGPDLVRDWID
ncbi:GNAT family protein [soil metagenome]